jgi:SAM-dependent methyltransferase
MARLPMEIPVDLLDLTPEVPSSLFDDAFRGACERLDRYVGALAVELCRRLDLPATEELDLGELFASRGWSPTGTLAIRWLRETLSLYGLGPGAERPQRQPDWVDRVPAAELRAEAERVLPSCWPAYAVLEQSADALPAILRGELRGEEALFGPANLGLWFDYFSNGNPHYAPNNAITSLVAAEMAPLRATVLELGGGAGSAAEAFLGALAEAGKPPARYLFTEPQPAFLRRATRALRQFVPPGCEVETGRYDINLGPTEQGLEESGFDLILAVNVMHLAHDVVLALRRVRRLLRPGGALVLGELIRPTPTAPVHLELPFTLIEGYRQTPPDAVVRRREGFVSADGWIAAFEAAGLEDVRLMPAQIRRCAEIYPGFYCGAVSARAPA